MTKVKREVLHRRWVHAHEEDTEEEMVFRPAEHELPPSRGRTAFELRPDGTFSEAGLGSVDVPEQAGGNWEFEDGERIVLGEGATGGVPRLMPISSCSSERLVIRKQEPG
ncbi:MAG: hypothetical protein M3360_08525 [Actinomycetota bacterium]|nr:hypothetical protein [Actinomycetota bacterium]